MRVCLFCLAAVTAFLPLSCSQTGAPPEAAVPSAAETAAAEPAANRLRAGEAAAGFRLLFNGQDLSGWNAAGNNWEVQDGAISRNGAGGGIDYVAEKIPDNFELRFEWKISPGGNSGVYYRPGQYEYQILDNDKHPDGKDPRTRAASLYYAFAPSVDATRPVGEWNQGRIVAEGTKIEHWLNDRKVVDIDYSDPQLASPVERLRKRGGKVEDRGRNLHLQDHDDPVWYRAIRLRTIP